VGANRIGVLGFGGYTPERVMTNEDWSRLIDTTDEWIVTRTGIERRRFAADGETSVDLAEAAARRALDDAGLGAEDIDEIIVATDTPEVYTPDTAAFLQHRLGAELISRLMDWEDRSTCILFGDGAGAVVMGRGDVQAEMLGAVAGTDGSKAGILTLETGGTRRPFTLEAAEAGPVITRIW